MPAPSYEALLNYLSSASGAAYNTSTTLTDVSLAPQLVLPANYLQIGQNYRLTAAGTFSNTATPTLLLGFYIGGVAGTAIGATGAITTITAATAWSWILELNFEVQVVGASGKIMPYRGRAQLPASLTQFQADYAVPATAPAQVTVDTTASKAITVGAQWGTNSASNTLTCTKFTIEQLN